MFENCLSLLKESCDSAASNKDEKISLLMKKKRDQAWLFLIEITRLLACLKKGESFSELYDASYEEFPLRENFFTGDAIKEPTDELVTAITNGSIDEELMIQIFKEILGEYRPPLANLPLIQAHLLCFLLFYGFFSRKMDSIPLAFALQVDFSFAKLACAFGILSNAMYSKGTSHLDRVYNSGKAKTNKKNEYAQMVLEIFFKMDDKEREARLNKSQNNLFEYIRRECLKRFPKDVTEKLEKGNKYSISSIRRYLKEDEQANRYIKNAQQKIKRVKCNV
jgi:hypothetical protein